VKLAQEAEGGAFMLSKGFLQVVLPITLVVGILRGVFGRWRGG
jgi:hypothetical protein